MCQTLEVKTAGQSGIPYVEIPHELMWDLVEYISCQRTLVHYSYQPSCFTVEFPHLDQSAVHLLLADWTEQENATMKRVEMAH